MATSIDKQPMKKFLFWIIAVLFFWIIILPLTFDFHDYFMAMAPHGSLAVSGWKYRTLAPITPLSPPVILRTPFIHKRDQPVTQRVIKRRSSSKPKGTNQGGLNLAQQQSSSQTLEHELHNHYEEESEDWWEVRRSYEYETSDSLGDLFLVSVEEAQVIHKQHALLDDLQHADVTTQDKESQGTLSAGGNLGLAQNNFNANSSSVAVSEIQEHQQEDLLDVKQYQKIHVLQVSAAGLMVNEYEEERLADYQYSLEVDIFNQWEYQSQQESQHADNFVVGYN
ncbi:10210_t:CDS:1 [Acaulospora morrowiae]|uniref:10210_t:CDS:1 n=1 Tax=Acaulospora morrowiae TaxID=94023 RepID=A0A9N8ZMK4_9GLOM|nr:10210_t:CDS:1 [Acaulospora morrowiae]